MAEQTAICSHCGKQLRLNHAGPCPQCGQEGVTIFQSVAAFVTASDAPQPVPDRRAPVAAGSSFPLSLVALAVVLFVVGFLIGHNTRWHAAGGLVLGAVLALIGVLVGPKVMGQSATSDTKF
jgi:uncharacterized membrane protein YvbJ